MDLASHLGKTLDELLTQISSEELSLWMARQATRPLPDSYWQTALISSTIARVNGVKCELEDFMPKRKVRMSSEQIKKHMKSL